MSSYCEPTYGLETMFNRYGFKEGWTGYGFYQISGWPDIPDIYLVGSGYLVWPDNGYCISSCRITDMRIKVYVDLDFDLQLLKSQLVENVIDRISRLKLYIWPDTGFGKRLDIWIIPTFKLKL